MPISIEADPTLAQGYLKVNGVTAATVTSTGLTTASLQDAAITPAKLSQPYTLATEQASTSGTSIDFTGIPSWAKRITVMLSGVSTSGTSIPLIRLGDSGGIETSGYSSLCSGAATTPIDTTRGGSSTDGIRLAANAHAASDTITGKIDIVNISANNWIAQGNIAVAGVFVGGVVGAKSTSATLDRLSITTANGTDTFDAGTINISYEG